MGENFDEVVLHLVAHAPLDGHGRAGELGDVPEAALPREGARGPQVAPAAADAVAEGGPVAGLGLGLDGVRLLSAAVRAGAGGGGGRGDPRVDQQGPLRKSI